MPCDFMYSFFSSLLEASYRRMNEATVVRYVRRSSNAKCFCLPRCRVCPWRYPGALPLWSYWTRSFAAARGGWSPLSDWPFNVCSQKYPILRSQTTSPYCPLYDCFLFLSCLSFLLYTIYDNSSDDNHIEFHNLKSGSSPSYVKSEI